ncbi:hypothetical protein KI387_006136 [Taxus chinensis]|uniref:Uncharacterized protein n=1 Tax=Taxus chinensis TaxID=29808 RepID=A0AA38GPT1_TAXCH|nr:hypothetical protein KI387_006136 [Taxus chinensis]
MQWYSYNHAWGNVNDDVPYMCQQNMKGVKAGRSSLVEGANAKEGELLVGSPSCYPIPFAAVRIRTINQKSVFSYKVEGFSAYHQEGIVSCCFKRVSGHHNADFEQQIAMVQLQPCLGQREWAFEIPSYEEEF